MQSQFSKRIYSPGDLKQAATRVGRSLRQMRSVHPSAKISRDFAEKIMLAVTQVNGCRYCDFGHSRAALAAGVPPLEIAALRSGGIDQLPAEEWPALHFAQHYAHTEGNYQPDSWDDLVEAYGSSAANQILAYIRLITFGNMVGNTFDALISRFRGRPAAESSALAEFAVLLGTLTYAPPIILWKLLGFRSDN